MQKKLNELVINIATSISKSTVIENTSHGEVAATFERDINGDIGLTSADNELTVYGLGGHRHFYGDLQDESEVFPIRERIINLIIGLISGKIVNYLISDFSGKRISGGYGLWSGSQLSIEDKPDPRYKITIFIHKDVTRVVTDSEVIGVPESSLKKGV